MLKSKTAEDLFADSVAFGCTNQKFDCCVRCMITECLVDFIQKILHDAGAHFDEFRRLFDAGMKEDIDEQNIAFFYRLTDGC